MSTLKELLDQKHAVSLHIQSIQATIQPRLEPLHVQMKEIDAAINAKATAQAATAFQGAGKDTGTLDFIHEGVKVKATIAKRVDWDQGQLAGIFKKIQSAGDDPEQYMKLKYDVSERSFTAWPDAIRSVFLPARTVKPSPPKFEFIPIDPEEIPF